VSNALPQSPVLVRKLRRKRHWQSFAATDDEQVTEIAQEVFLYDRTPYSMYRVSSEAELDRVALALNSGRDSLTEECCFVCLRTRRLRKPASRSPSLPRQPHLSFPKFFGGALP